MFFCYAKLLNDKISLQINFQPRNIILFYILQPRSIIFFTFFVKKRRKMTKNLTKINMQTTPNYSFLIVRANFPL